MTRTIALVILVLATNGVGQRSLGQITTLILPGDTKVRHVWRPDLSGDGRPDVVIATRKKGVDHDRTLRIHYDKGPTGKNTADKVPFRQRPDMIIPVPRTVVACAVADMHGDPGNELLWFGARGVYVLRHQAPSNTPEAERVVKLIPSEFLFQFPHRADIHSWQHGVRDIDGDGRQDLLLPEPDGYRIAVQRRDARGKVSFRTSVLSLPRKPPKKQSSRPRAVRGSFSGDKVAVEFSFGGDSVESRPPLVDVEEKIPAPRLLDWDGDGDLDVIALQGERVFVWRQHDAAFPAQPDVELPFPLTTDQIKLDPGYSAWITDFNQDRRADAVLFAKDRNSDDIRTQVLFFPQRQGAEHPLFNKGVPGQLLILAGFITRPTLRDIDGDGLPDLQVGSWRLDLLNQMTAGADQSIDVELYVYLNHDGRFARHPSLTHKVTLDGDDLRGDGEKHFARFIGDITGDGVSELLVRDQPDRVRLFMVRRQGKGLSILSRPMFEIGVDKKARIPKVDPATKPAGFVILEANQVVVVTF